MNPPAIAGLILSAGASRRMGTPKALLEIQGEAFLERLIRVLSTTCQPIAVVLGHDAERIRAGISIHTEAIFTTNPDPERGMFSSLQCALAEVPASAEAVLFTPVDYPGIQPATVAAIARAFTTGRSPVTIPRYQGQRGHPVCISRDLRQQMLALPATGQAHDLIRSYREQTCFVEVDDPGILADIDNPEDYQNLRANLAPVSLP